MVAFLANQSGANERLVPAVFCRVPHFAENGEPTAVADVPFLAAHAGEKGSFCVEASDDIAFELLRLLASELFKERIRCSFLTL